MVLSDIPFELDPEAILRRLHMDAEGPYAAEMLEVARAVAAAARPKALYEVAYIEARSEEKITIDGVVFTSRVLRANLSEVDRVFPYVATCGIEMDAVPIPGQDYMAEYCRDAVKEMALAAARNYLLKHVRERFGLKRVASMNPGSGDLHIWPIEQQKELFALLGDVEGQIGVRLTPSCLMHPNKTVSGILYPTEVDFVTCRLCHRENCENRRAAFDQRLWDEKVRATEGRCASAPGEA